MDVELQATCSSLGFLEGNEYIKEPDCLETVKDLIRFLRRDTDICDIRRQLGHAQILQNDLIPLIKCYHADKALFDTVIKLMVNLTQPVVTCFNNEIPDEKTLRNYCLEVESYLQDYKEAFVSEDLFNVLAEKIQDILKLDWDERREEDRLQLERLFVLIRNVLMIPSDPDREQRTDDDASIHDQILWTIHTSGVEDLILYVASSDRERNMLCMHVLEIIFLMFKEQEVETIVSAGLQRSVTEKERDQKELEQAREKEKTQRKANKLKFSNRHSRFGGTYIIKNMKSISESDVIYHKPLCEMDKFSLDAGKAKNKRAKNRAPIKAETTKRRPTLSVRLSLKEFCVQFLVNAYNPLMRAIKDALTRKTAQDNDETYYLWTMRFFMQFSRLHCRRVDLVSETMSLPSFHYIYTQLCTYYENIRLGKGEECKTWGRRAHLALKAYQELLYTLDFMCKSENERIRESAKIIQSNVFYMVEYRDVFVTLLKNFQESKCSRAYLRDLVESTHIFLKMLEGFLKSSRHLIVQKKVKQKRKAKKNNLVGDNEPSDEDLAEVWCNQVSRELLLMLESHSGMLSVVTPFDAASEMDMNEQRVEAMYKIQFCLREKNLSEAVSLFRAAREVWPEEDEFGSDNMSVEEELSTLQEIFMATLQRSQSQRQQNIEEVEDDNEIDEEEREETRTCETEFDFKTFINDFAHHDLIKNYAILLEEFATNSDHVNHCVIKMLHRLSYDLGYVGMLFQASVFRSFNCLLQGPYACLQRYQELTTFACFVVRQFTNIAKINKKVFVDLLFWKSKNEALAITGDYDFKQKSKVKMLWTEHEEQELQALYEKYRDITHPELDLVELIQGELTSSHTRLQILRELKKQGLITSAKDIKKKGVRPRKWSEDELQKLKDAFYMHSKSDYPILEIMNTINTDKSKRVVIAKLIDLGMVHDKRQLLKQKLSKGRCSKRPQSVSDGEGGRLFAESDTRGEQDTKRRRRKITADDDCDSSESKSDVGNSDGDNDENMHLLVQQPPVTISNHVSGLIEKGYKRQIDWLVRGLRNAAEDRSDGVCVPTPLVPLTEENEIAMEDEVFLNFLHSIGITPPLSEQEMFWRIPAEYCASDLSKIAGHLELSISGPATEANDIHEIVSSVFPMLSTLSAAFNNQDIQRTRHEITGNITETKQKSKGNILRDKLFNRHLSRQIKDRGNNSQELASQQDEVDVLERSDIFDPSFSKDSDTSDSGLDLETEAKEQERIKAEKHGKDKASTEKRKQTLKLMAQMMNARKEKAQSKRNRKEADSLIEKYGEGHSAEVNEEQPVNFKQDKRVYANKSKTLVTEFDSQSSLSPASIRLGKPRSSLKSKAVSTGQHTTASFRKRMLESDSDSNDMQPSLKNTNNDDGEVLNHPKMAKRIRFLSSDDDVEDSGDHGKTLQKELKTSLKLHFSDCEDGTLATDKEDNTSNEAKDSFPATLFTQSLDSDEEDDHIPLQAVIRERKSVIDDDEQAE